jgi:hypothetical protein
MVSAAAISVNVAYGHGVCAMESCDTLLPCYSLTIIRECGIPTASLHDYQSAGAGITSIAALLSAALFAFRNYYLKRKDFYVVR